jgi:hypothetical protein
LRVCGHWPWGLPRLGWISSTPQPPLPGEKSCCRRRQLAKVEEDKAKVRKEKRKKREKLSPVTA